MWNAIVQTLAEWKARILAFIPVVYGLITAIEPQWVVDIVGVQYKGWVMVGLVGGAFILHQLIPNPAEDKAQ